MKLYTFTVDHAIVITVGAYTPVQAKASLEILLDPVMYEKHIKDQEPKQC